MLVHHSGKSEKQRLRDGILGSQLLNAFAETMHAFGPTNKENRIRIERGNKDYKFPDVCVDFKVDEYRFRATVSEVKESDVSEDFEASMTRTMATEFKTYQQERDEWREFVTSRHVSSKQLAEHFGYAPKTVASKMSRYDIYYDPKYGTIDCQRNAGTV
jgi:hypothetical protein